MVAMHALGTNGPETFAGESAWLAIKVHSRIIPGVTAAPLEGMMEEDGVDPNGTGYGLAICAAARLGWDRSKLQVRLQPSPAAPFPV